MPNPPDSREVEMVDAIESYEEQTDDSMVSESQVITTTSAEKDYHMSLDTHAKSPNILDVAIKSLAKVSDEKDESGSDDNGSQAAQVERTISESSLQANSKLPQLEKAPLTASDQIKLIKEKARVMEVISNVSPEAAQQVLREMWRLFLFDGYNESHITFIVRAGLKNANLPVIERVLKDDAVFGAPFQHVASQKPAIIGKVLKNATLIQLLEHLPQSIIDKMVGERIKDAPAKDLIFWLAEGDRLGFRRDDTLDESDESVVPNIPPRTQAQPQINFQIPPVHTAPQVYIPPILPPQNAPIAQRDPLLAEQERNKAAQDAASFHAAEARTMQFISKSGKKYGPPEDLVCKYCNRRLPTLSGYNFHVWKKVCLETKQTDGRWVCSNCFSPFLGKQGLNYHDLRDVCRKNSTVSGSPGEEGRGVAPSTQPPPQAPKATPAAILPPRPPMYSAPPPPPPSQKAVQAIRANNFTPSNSIVPAPQRPPMHTPQTKQGGPVEYRMSPSELPIGKLAAMNRDIEDEDERYRKKIEELPSDLSEAERANRLAGYKNANATRKSQIRKSYGVSLRLREKDKQAKAAAGLTQSSRMEDIRSSKPIHPPHMQGAGTPKVSGFSPINTPGSGEASVNGFAYTPTTSKYRPPPSNSADRVYNPKSHHPDTISHARENMHANSGFGILKTSNPSPIPPVNYQQVQQTNKRRRTSESTSSPGTGYNSPQAQAAAPPSNSRNSALAMIHSEDAAAKYAKKSNNNNKRATTPPRRQSKVLGPQDAPKTNITPSKNIAVVLPSMSGSGTKESAYTIVDSSSEETGEEAGTDDGDEEMVVTEENGGDEDDADELMDKPLPSIEKTSSDRPGFKARRGGKR